MKLQSPAMPAADRPKASVARPAAKSTRRRRGLFRNLLRILLLWTLVVAFGSLLFIGVNCYSPSPRSASSSIPAVAVGVPGYARAESFTYLTLPEWFIVFSADEYASFVATRPPSAFPYVGSARQYWRYYGAACAVTKGKYPFETGHHLMLGVIGASFTVESSLKALYENTLGRLTEWLASTDTPEDAFARRVAKEYGTFMHTVPWYEFPFAARLGQLWRETPLSGPHLLRKIERRFALTAEYGVKAVYGWVIGAAAGAADAPAQLRVHALIEKAGSKVLTDGRVQQVKALGPGSSIVTLPRYEAFSGTALAVIAQNARFRDIAGNDEILITVLARRGVPFDVPQTRLVMAAPVLTDPTMQRLAFSVPVTALNEVVAHLGRDRASVEHLYDY